MAPRGPRRGGGLNGKPAIFSSSNLLRNLTRGSHQRPTGAPADLGSMPKNRVHAVSNDRATVDRLVIVAGVAVLWALAVFLRLGYLQLVRHGDYLARAQKQQQRTIDITPQRGTIFDRAGHPLAMSVPVKSAFAVPSEIADESMVAHLLSGIVNVPEDVLLQRLQSSRGFAWVGRKLPPEKVEGISELNL